MRWWREAAGRGALIVLSIVLLWGAGEIALRLAAERPDPEQFRAFRRSSVPGLNYEFQPGARLPWAGRSVRVNTAGFRGPEFATERTAARRIAVIGDSVAAGYGVAESEAFPFLLEDLSRREGINVEVLDLGVPGYNIGHILALWEARGRHYGADLVIYAACLNDIMPDLHLTERGLLEGPPVILSTGVQLRGRVPLPGKDWLREHSLFYQFVSQRYAALLRRFGLRPPEDTEYARIQRIYSDPERWTYYGRGVLRVAESVWRTGAKFAVLCFPVKPQLAVRDRLPQERLGALCLEIGIPFLDLYDEFLRRSTEGADHLFVYDSLHPSAVGHSIAAETLNDIVTREGR